MRRKSQTPQLQHEKKGYLFALLAAVCLAGYLLINRYVYTTYSVSPLSYTTTFLLAASLFALVSIIVNSQVHKERVFTKSLTPVILNGAFAGAAVGIVVIAQNYTTAINASILSTVTIITTVFFFKSYPQREA